MAASAAVIRLATRGSTLARAQAALAEAALRANGAGPVDTVVVRTIGDRQATVPLDRLTGQGWFTAELERAIVDGRADIAVHSAKDLPTDYEPGLEIAALLERGDARDAVVTRDGATLASLRAGSTVGTSSTRRAALMSVLWPALRPVPMRGNVDTRLRALAAGKVDALIVACAGVDRLGMGDRIAERLDPTVFVPAPAQGAIALEARTGSEPAGLAARLAHGPTVAAVTAERALLAALGGGCLLPLGAWARIEHGRLVLSAALGVGATVRRAELEGDPADPARLGLRLARLLG